MRRAGLAGCARRLAGAFALAFSLAACAGGEDPALTVYAPASLADLVEEAAALHYNATGVLVRTRIEASGMLAREIVNGAPADLFISADQRWFDYLEEHDALDASTRRLLAWNTLTVVVPKTAATIPMSAGSVAKLDRIAVGSPETVPAGAYALQAFDYFGLAEEVAGKLVETVDVRAALTLAERGEVDAAVVYGTDAEKSNAVIVAFTFPRTSHDAIVYPAAVVGRSRHRDRAREFLDFLSGPGGRKLFTRHGFQGAS